MEMFAILRFLYIILSYLNFECPFLASRLYKKAMNPMKKKEASYVVMKKKHGGKKPKGTKGPYKLVDKRLKKDKRGMKKAEGKKSRPRPGRPKKKARKN